MLSVHYSFSYYCGCNLSPVYKLTQLILGFGMSTKGFFRFAGNQVYGKKNQGRIGGDHQLSSYLLKRGTPEWVLDQYLGIGEPLKV